MSKSEGQYEPKGHKFYDAKKGEMMLIYDGGWKGWLAYRHPDGQWVTMRKATSEDLHSLGLAIPKTNHEPNTTQP